MNIGLREATLNFELKDPIGQEGKNSEVFKAHDKQFDAEIVIKRVPKSDFTDSAEYYKEAKCLYASKHQNIVSVNYSCEDDDYIYVAMPLYGNGSLETILSNRILTVREVLKYSIDFLSGLNHIHTKGLIHFDIKPTNILVSDSNEALLTDFGLSKFTNIHRVAGQNQFYKLHVAPECYVTNMFTIQVDIYQAGLTLYRLFNGTDHFKNQLHSVTSEEELKTLTLSGKFPDRNLHLPHVPKKIRDIIKKALQVDPSKRYNNVIEMLNDLSKVDDNLDWVMKTSGNKMTWTLDKDNKTYDITLTNNGPDFDIETYKTMKDSGNRTRETSNFFSKLPFNEADNQLKKILVSY